MTAVRKNNKKEDAEVVDQPEPEELADTLKEIRKRYGVTSVSKGSSIAQPAKISTGSFILDFATLGGLPCNRISKYVGNKSSGKTTMSYKILANMQKQQPNKQTVFIDIEGTYDNVWAAKNGIDTDAILVLHPETGEAALDMADALISTMEVSLLVVDSLAFLVPVKELESSAEDQHIGLQSRLIGSFVRKAVSGLLKERLRGHFITMLFLNQLRTKVGGWSPTGEPLTEPGGKSLGFAYSVEATLKNKELAGKNHNDVEMIEVNEHAFNITKNKCNNGPRSGEFRLCRVNNPELGLNEADIDDASTMLAYGKKFGVYTGAGASWTLQINDFQQKFGSAEKTIKFLYENRDVYWKLRNKLIQMQAESLGMPAAFLRRFD